MQATVASFDQHDRSGSVLLDDGSRKTFDCNAFDVSQLRLLRLGQRVTLHTNAQGDIIKLRLPTMP